MSYTCVEGASHLFLCIYYALCDWSLVISFHINACIQGELTLRFSSSWMSIAYIYNFIVCFDKKKKISFEFILCLYWWFDKKGERTLEIYICMFSLCMFTFVYFYNWYKSNWYQSMFISFHVYMHEYSSFMHILLSIHCISFCLLLCMS